GHGWTPGPRVREEIHNADVFVHGMEGFQPWVDDIKTDLAADGSGVVTVDASADVDLLEADGDRDDEHDEDTHDDEDQDEHEHDEAMDPHFWMDPLRLEQAAGTVRQGLADVDPDNADAYTENADAYRARLNDLHEQIESVVAEASKDTVLVAGHDALGYFSDRYGVAVESLTNVSPDDRPTQQDIERAQEIIDAHDLQYVCADPLESQQAAEQLVEETDAEEVLPLTSIPGQTEQWAEDDWGYVEIMKNVNLQTLERALE
ncbi:MAG: metal ABC transporter substrate-binding protein, partial [Haloferacaceae archaeon]